MNLYFPPGAVTDCWRSPEPFSSRLSAIFLPKASRCILVNREETAPRDPDDAASTGNGLPLSLRIIFERGPTSLGKRPFDDFLGRILLWLPLVNS